MVLNLPIPMDGSRVSNGQRLVDHRPTGSMILMHQKPKPMDLLPELMWFRLTVIDNKGGTDYDDVTVYMTNN
jgi:hypothetical protein